MKNSASPHEVRSADPRLRSDGSQLQVILSPTPTAGTTFNQKLIRAFRQGKWIVLGTFLITLALTALFTFTREPVYRATSVLYIDSGPSSFQLDDLFDSGEVSRNIKNEVAVITSRTLALEVASRLMRESRRAGVPPLTVLRSDEETPLTIAEVADRLRESYIDVAAAGTDVDLINVRAVSTLPEEARYIVRTYTEAYSDYNLTSSRSTMTASRELLDEVTARFSDQLHEAEEELVSFLDEEDLVEPDEEARQLLERVGELQSLHYQTKLALGVANAELDGLDQEVERIMPSVAERLSSSDDVLVDRLKEQIAALQIEKQQIYARYPTARAQRPEDGRLAAIEREMENLKRQLDEHVERLVATASDASPLGSTSTDGSSNVTANRLQAIQDLRRQVTAKVIEVSGLQARLAIIDDELDRYQARLAAIPGKAIVLERLERTRQSQEEIYLTLLEKVQEARIAEQARFGHSRVIDEAYVPEEPVRPRKALNLSLGALLGLLLGGGLAFVWSKVDVAVRSPEDLEERGLRVLGIVPSLTHDLVTEGATVGGATAPPLPSLDPYSPLSEEYRRIHANIQFSDLDSEPSVILITSAMPQEGKSVTASNLAATIAQSGRKTLLVDGDLHVAGVTGEFGFSSEPGLVDLLSDTGSSSLSLYAKPTPVRNLYLLPAGKEVSNPGAILNSKKLQELFEIFRAEFEVVVVDSPPVLSVADPLLLAPKCDAVLVTTYAGRTDSRKLEQAIKAIHNTNGEICGAILNGLDGSKDYSSYGYQSENSLKYRRKSYSPQHRGISDTLSSKAK